MTKMEYAQAIANAVGGKVKEVNKNGVIMTAVTKVTEGIAPVLYVEKGYENGVEVEEMVETFNQALVNASQNNAERIVNVINNWESAKEIITTKLVNKSRNTSTVYRSAKGYGMDDLVIVPIMKISIVGNNGVATVTEAMIKSWGVTKRTVIDRAIKNTVCRIEKLSTKLAAMTGIPEERFESPFIIVSNVTGFYGASAILNAREQLAKMLPNGYYIIPSSVHEVLVIPKEYGADSDKLDGLIGDVNENVLANEDYLSDHAYEVA